MKKGQISFMMELFIGAVLIMIIVSASYYFAQKSNITAEAIVYAQNAKTNCNVNINTLMQSDDFLGGKTSIVLALNHGETDSLLANLETIQLKLSDMLKEPFSLKLSETCTDITEACTPEVYIAEQFSTIAGTPSDDDSAPARISTFDETGNIESCVYVIPIPCNPGSYPAEDDSVSCNMFAEMGVNY